MPRINPPPRGNPVQEYLRRKQVLALVAEKLSQLMLANERFAGPRPNPMGGPTRPADYGPRPNPLAGPSRPVDVPRPNPYGGPFAPVGPFGDPLAGPSGPVPVSRPQQNAYEVWEDGSFVLPGSRIQFDPELGHVRYPGSRGGSFVPFE